jgi:8-oxo-dGTP diphosphatase
VTAVREVLEETSVPIRLGLPMSTVQYDVNKPKPLTKRVSYWVARPVSTGEFAHGANDEVDDVRWVPVSKARSLLTYDRDHKLVTQLLALQKHSHHKTRPLIVLRHGHAHPRRSGRVPTSCDRCRPRDCARPSAGTAARRLRRDPGGEQLVDAVRADGRPVRRALGVELSIDAGLSEEELPRRR